MAEEEEPDRPSADTMDEERRRQIAIDYLCRLAEARNWLIECLNIELPEAVDLEESFRNGVTLAKLGHFIAPKVLPERKIFDIDQQRYTNSGLHFRHTDNTVQWEAAMKSVGLPEVFMPETTDIYDNKNMPKAVFCLHALSRYLSRRGLAPPMRDVTGAAFKEEDISAMAEELASKGLRMPEFHKIDGMLAEEMTVDQTQCLFRSVTPKHRMDSSSFLSFRMHDAIRGINEAMDGEDKQKLLAALRDLNAQIENLRPSLIDEYVTALNTLRENKRTQQKLIKRGCPEKRDDMYDWMLTRDQIQQVIDQVNEQHVLSQLNTSITEGDADMCVQHLQDVALHLPAVHPQANELYLKELKRLRGQQPGPLNREQVLSVVEFVNAVVDVNNAVQVNNRDQLLAALQQPRLQLKNVKPAKIRRYMKLLTQKASETPGHLVDLAGIVSVIAEADVAMNEQEIEQDFFDQCFEAAVDEANSEKLYLILSQNDGKLRNLMDGNATAYMIKFQQLAKENKTPVTFSDMQSVIDQVNNAVQQLVQTSNAVFLINQCLRKKERVFDTLTDNANLLQANVRPEVQQRYELTLAAHSQQKSEAWKEKEWPSLCQPSSDQSFCVLMCDLSGKYSVTDRVGTQPWLTQHEIKDTIDKANTSFDAQFSDTDHAKIVKSQSQVRSWLAKRAYQRRLAKLQQEQMAAQKIQMFYKQQSTRRMYRELAHADAPRLRVVRAFAQLLERTEQDYEEELDTELLKSDISSLIRSNKKLEDNLSIMDVKIGLLIRNRLDAEEVLKHGEKMTASQSKTDKQPGNGTPGSVRRGSTVLKAYQDKIGAYQHIMYHLQTEPKHISKLVLGMNSSRLDRFIDSVVLPLFNHGAKGREEYLLLNLWQVLLKMELTDRVTKLEDLNGCKLQSAKMALGLSRRLGTDTPLKKVMQPLIDEMLSDKNVKVNTQPLEIYKYAVGEPDASMKVSEAAAHPEVAAVLTQSIEYLASWAERFVALMSQSANLLPYSLRFIVHQLRLALGEQFPNETEKNIQKVICQFTYENYLHDMITQSDTHDVQATLSPHDKKKLACVAKLLQFCSANKGYGADHEHLSALNPCIKKLSVRMKEYVSEVCTISSAQDYCAYEPMMDVTNVRKPTVYLLVGDVLYLHQVIVDYKQLLVADDEQMGQMVTALGAAVPSVNELTAGGAGDAAELQQTQLTLQLKCSHTVNVSQVTAEHSLFLRTKKLVVDLMLCARGASVIELLERKPSDAERLAYIDLVSNRKQRAQENRMTYDPSQVSSLDELQEIVTENLEKLEGYGRVNRSDDYQAIVSAIAHDVRHERQYRERRRNELNSLRRTLAALEAKQVYFREQAECYREYINGCLQNLAPKHNATKSKSDAKKDKEARRPSWTTQTKSLKYSAEKLSKKKLLVSMKDEAPMKNTTFEFKSTDQPGSFEIVGKFGSDEKANSTEVIQFHELLKLQYDGDSTICLLEKANFSVDELIYFLNKKFF